MNNFKFKIERSLSKINKSEWNNCANTNDSLYNPFVSYEFLNALEVSQSINNDTGWFSTYLLAESNEGELLGCVPSFIKNNSNGEYVFDHEWANAYQRSGGSYYPKIQVSIPFTPVTGRRFLVKDRLKDINIISELSYELSKLTKETNASSAHVTFLTKKESDILKELGWLTRKDQQFHWKNNNYKSFDDFLKTLSSRKRKVIKKERLCIDSNNLKIKLLIGDKITPEHWDFFYQCYLNTTGRKWGSAYLTKDFFLELSKTLADKILLIVALKEEKMVASAINFLSSTHLYGRLWGTMYDIPYLHFELCYYQAIDYAIANNIKIVEAGAQGEHKLQRGYMPEKIWSLHWIKDQQFSKAINKYLDQEISLTNKQKKDLEQFAPFKNN